MTLNRPVRLAALASVPALLGIWFGYGTDIDITNVLLAGQSILDRDYAYSRPPGSFPFELIASVLDHIGGSIAVNIGSLVMGFVVLLGVATLVRDAGRPMAPVVLVLAASPWWWIATTSLGDFVWALAAIVTGAVLARRDRRVLAGIAFGCAIGIRASSIFVIAAWLVAERVGTEEKVNPRATVRTAVVSVLVGSAWFIPSWIAADHTFAFLDSEFDVSGPKALLGRWVVKNAAFFGLIVAAVLVVRFNAVIAAVREWRSSVLVRFGVLGFAVAELLYLRFPWKPLHLLPALLCFALVLSSSDRRVRTVRLLVIAGFIVQGLVTVTVATPDVPDNSRSARLSIAVKPGVIVNEMRCRLEDRDRGPWPPVATPEADDRAHAVFSCQEQLWRTDG